MSLPFRVIRVVLGKWSLTNTASIYVRFYTVTSPFHCRPESRIAQENRRWCVFEGTEKKRCNQRTIPMSRFCIKRILDLKYYCWLFFNLSVTSYGVFNSCTGCGLWILHSWIFHDMHTFTDIKCSGDQKLFSSCTFACKVVGEDSDDTRLCGNAAIDFGHAPALCLSHTPRAVRVHLLLKHYLCFGWVCKVVFIWSSILVWW